MDNLPTLEKRLHDCISSCDVHVPVRLLIDVRVCHEEGYACIATIYQQAQEHYAKEFGICLESKEALQWTSEGSNFPMRLNELMFAQKDLVLTLELTPYADLFQMQESITCVCYGLAVKNGNHALVSLASPHKLKTVLHEIGHIFGADDVMGNSVMHPVGSSLEWDFQNKETIFKNKQRSWEVPEEMLGLYGMLDRWRNDQVSRETLKKAYLLMKRSPIQNVSQAKTLLTHLVEKYPLEADLQYLFGISLQISGEKNALEAYRRAVTLGCRYKSLQESIDGLEKYEKLPLPFKELADKISKFMK